jgi:hypothetical protein
MSISKTSQVNQFGPLKKTLFIVVVIDKVIQSWGFRKRKKNLKTFMGLFFAIDIYLKQI